MKTFTDPFQQYMYNLTIVKAMIDLCFFNDVPFDAPNIAGDLTIVVPYIDSVLALLPPSYPMEDA